jgi:hypothetical protein
MNMTSLPTILSDPATGKPYVMRSQFREMQRAARKGLIKPEERANAIAICRGVLDDPTSGLRKRIAAGDALSAIEAMEVKPS